ncbi:SEC10/PgrA surface exclusion domain-containing protein [Streptococcus pyogenes]|uniref:SEC10/PgrA surface exclusion domain-containing protein n=1 Tax=Streptococcus pyogenes TaxID=1314 RepID=UPI00109D3FA0|nr:SEC10/PgrA surface exclusion domain-containing protein [Streptococcus pyogenes]UEN88817.1 SEC10/PgrA surface exclusion domain-containing protein [Streptococcus pyogenes]VHF71175.1 surface exclusion protein [Streptococcus pyogenes]HEP1351076.1 SEC10/PgrA surface exclusion domain-containing protein [Streptococcus pyogenes]HEQ4501136.1 SEC10/PgrA surface exclusion domain-containing protein [Streptococcus pyogenes]HEQ4516524.1 SEC10/PgrA surface exclusion domain-containing protein [Streptococcu
MDLEQTKPNQVKQKIALTSTIALLSASVGVSHQVKADDRASGETKASNTHDDSLPKPETIQEAKATIDAVEKTLSQQKAELTELATALTKTTAEINHLKEQQDNEQKALTSAQEIYTNTLASSEETLLAQGAEHQRELTATETELHNAQVDQHSKETALSEQKASISAETTRAQDLVEQVKTSEQNIAKLNAMISNPDAITKAAQTANDNTKALSSELEKAKADLENQKAKVKKQLTEELAAQKAALAEKEAELSRLKSSAPSTQDSIVGNNTMKAPQGYPLEELKKLEASGYIGSASYNNYYKEHADQIIAKASPGNQLNQYQDIPADRNRFVDPDNLTPEVQNELAQFAAHMINSVRRQLGLPPVTVTAGSQEFARLLSTSYKKTHGNTRPSFVYGQPGVSGHYGVGPHDKTIIEDSAGASGLIRNDDNMYENIGAFNDVHTVNGIKRGIYDSIKYMLFTDHLHGNTYGHAINFLRVDKRNPNAPVYLGFSTSNVGSLNEHFVMFPESNIANHQRFNKTPIKAVGSTKDYAQRVGTVSDTIAAIKGKVSSLENRLSAIHQEADIMAAQAKVSQLQGKLASTLKQSDSLNLQVRQLNDTKGSLRTELLAAKAKQAQLEATRDQSLAKLASLKAALHQTEALAEQAAARVTALVAKKAHLQYLRDFKLNPNRLQVIRERIDNTKQDLAKTTSSLLNAQEALAALQAKQSSLEATIATTEHQLTLLKTLANEKEYRHLDEDIATVPDLQVAPPLTGVKPLSYSKIDTTPLVQEMVKETKQLLEASARLAAENTSLVAEALVGQTSEMVASNAIVSKITSSITQPSSKTSYGSGSSTTSNLISDVDESTQRALKAGVVMLAAVGLTGFRFRKESR